MAVIFDEYGQGMSVYGDPSTNTVFSPSGQGWSWKTPVYPSTGQPMTKKQAETLYSKGDVLGAAISTQPKASPSEQDRARKTLEDMNAGKITWDDNLRAWANKILSSAQDSSAAQEEAERAAAEAEWQRVAGELKARKSELGPEKERGLKEVKTEVEKGTKELGERREKRVKQYGRQLEETKETLKDEGAKLARNFRDMSLKVAMAMRASGVQLSSYSQQRQADLEDIYMRGSKELAKEGTKAVSLVNEAIQEANDYFDRKIDETKQWGQTAKEKILDWYNNQISSINRELSYNDFTRAAAIKAAKARAAQTLANVKTQIANQQMQLGVWLAKQKYAIDNAMATAAAGKSSTAVNTLNELLKQLKVSKEMIGAAAQGVIYGIPGESKEALRQKGIYFLPTEEQLKGVYQTTAEEDALKKALLMSQTQKAQAEAGMYGYGQQQESKPFWQFWR